MILEVEVFGTQTGRIGERIRSLMYRLNAFALRDPGCPERSSGLPLIMRIWGSDGSEAITLSLPHDQISHCVKEVIEAYLQELC